MAAHVAEVGKHALAVAEGFRGRVNQVITATGRSAPQNVNYAVKTDYMIPLLRAALGDQWSLLSGGGPQREMSEIVERAEGSVFLVIVR